MSVCERVNQSEAHFQSLPGHTSVHVTYLNYVSMFYVLLCLQVISVFRDASLIIGWWLYTFVSQVSERV